MSRGTLDHRGGLELEFHVTTDTSLIEKREELKRRLAAGEYKTLVDVFLAWTNRVIQRITRRSKPLPTWLITVILALVITLIGFGAISLAGDLKSIQEIGESFGVGNGLIVGFLVRFLTPVFSIFTVIVMNQAIGRIFILGRDHLVDATESMKSLVDYEDWLRKTCNVRQHLLATVFGGLLIIFFVIYVNKVLLGVFIGYGLTVQIILTDLFIGAFFYQFLMVILLPPLLRRFDLKLFSSDPATSELLARLAGELGFFVYFIAVYAALITWLGASQGVLRNVGFILVLFLWLPIIGMFALNQTSLSGMIRRAKWKTLNEAQAKIEKLRASENFGDQETMDAIKRLMDYHDRVKATRNSALDLRTYLGFINSLLLPLLAFILGNLDLVVSMFASKP